MLFGLPFLLHNSHSYLSMAYNFDRSFAHVEQMNFTYLTQEMFDSESFRQFLLAGHLITLIVLLVCKWTTWLREVPALIKSLICIGDGTFIVSAYD